MGFPFLSVEQIVRIKHVRNNKLIIRFMFMTPNMKLFAIFNYTSFI